MTSQMTSQPRHENSGRELSPFGATARRHPGRWEFWKFNWLIHHRMIAALERSSAHASGTLLDVGCGSRPFEPLFQGRITRAFGTDLARSPYLGDRRPDAFARAEALPVRSGAIDTVLATSMLTCLPEPSAMLREVHRVLRPGGVAILEFEQMIPVHDEPHDYFRFTRFGAAHLLESAGLEPVEFIPVGGLMSKVGMSLIGWLNRVNRGPTRILTEIPVRILYVVLQLGFALLDRLFFDPREVMAHIVVARRKR